MTAAASRQQIAAIHTIAKALRIDDGVRRTIMHDETGKMSSAQMTDEEAGRVIKRLKALQSTVGAAAKGALVMDGPYAAKLRALWIAGWNLGVVRERSDKALCSFIERQCGISHPRFLRDPADAAKAIEGIKAWLAREAGIKWPPRGDDNEQGLEAKRAVVWAQAERLATLGRPTSASIFHCSPAQLDTIARNQGQRLRRLIAGKGE